MVDHGRLDDNLIRARRWVRCGIWRTLPGAGGLSSARATPAPASQNRRTPVESLARHHRHAGYCFSGPSSGQAAGARPSR